MNKPELLALTESLTPAETVAFWMPESEMEAMELELGAGVRLKTRGDGPFLGEQCSPRWGLMPLYGLWGAPGFLSEGPSPLLLRAHGAGQVRPPCRHDPLRLISQFPGKVAWRQQPGRSGSWGAAQSSGSCGCPLLSGAPSRGSLSTLRPRGLQQKGRAPPGFHHV